MINQGLHWLDDGSLGKRANAKGAVGWRYSPMPTALKKIK